MPGAGNSGDCILIPKMTGLFSLSTADELHPLVRSVSDKKISWTQLVEVPDLLHRVYHLSVPERSLQVILGLSSPAHAHQTSGKG